MKNKINKFIIVELILMLGSIIANIFYSMGKISRDPVEIGFVLVLFGSAVANYFVMKGKNKGEKLRTERSPLEIGITLIIGIAWIISYGFTI